ncbi:MAG: MFS transporter [Thermoanaerobaculia bacterium]|nr:MFS transporter [Thermoanaerobaculia bacterium]
MSSQRDGGRLVAGGGAGSRPHLRPEEIDHGLRMLLLDGVSTQVMGALTGGALLVGFALLLGASNKVIGLIAAAGPLTQLLQIPAILLVERTRRRKALAIVASLASRLSWVAIALIPLVVPPDLRIPVLLASLLFHFAGAAVASTPYNSWKRDLVPDPLMPRYFAKRLTFATAVGAGVALLSGFAVDYGERLFGDQLTVFSPLFLLGAVTGLLGVGFLGRIPEPRMRIERERGLREIFSQPLRDENFRKLLIFLGSWNFAVNLAAPFFTVYLLSRLGLPMAWVLGLSVVSQLANVLFFTVWGELAGRVGNKRVLSLAGSLFVLTIALWPFTTLPERYIFTVPLLVAIHLLAGISTAGVNLCAGSITLKLAPRGAATAFLATNSLASGLAATVAAALAGVVADLFATTRLSLQLHGSRGGADHKLLTALDLSGLDFLFALAALFGLYSLHRLLAVREEGEIEEADALVLLGEVRRAVRASLSTVAGLRRLSAFPYDLLLQRRRPPEEEEGERGETADPTGR